jgi:hypothetical protein
MELTAEQQVVATEQTNTAVATAVEAEKTRAAAAEATELEKTKAPAAFKEFSTEDDYNNSIKSERSKAKNEILVELGLTNVAEGKEALTKTSTLQEAFDTATTKATKLEESLALTKLGIGDDYAQEALALAKGRVNDKVDLTAALTEVSKKFPVMLGKSIVKTPDIGGERKEDTSSADEGTLKKNLSKKYPWLKF